MNTTENLRATLRPIRILLAEDTEENCMMFEAFLAHTPYRLVIVNNGCEKKYCWMCCCNSQHIHRTQF